MQQQARYTRPSQLTNARTLVGAPIRPHPASTPASDLNAPRQAQCNKRSVGKRLWQVASASQSLSTSSTDETVVSQTASEVVKADLPYTEHKWRWRGHTINYVTAGCGNPVLLVHGFGLSSSHYRKTIKELSKSYKVYAIDLLGFGKSSKPLLQYTLELWRDLVIDFLAEFTSGRSTTVVGNSIGALVCLMVAADAPPDVVRGVVLLNSAGAMNNKGVLGDWRIILLYPLFLLIDFLLSIPQVAAAIFKNLSTKENIKQALRQVYSNKDAVTDELVDLIHAPSLDPNAREVFISVITGPPGPNPFQLIPRIHVPILTLWGDKDTLTPSDGPLGKFFKELPSKRPNTTYKFLNGVGHCLHDDMPELVHAELLPWLRELHTGSATDCVVGQPPAQEADAATSTTAVAMADKVMP